MTVCCPMRARFVVGIVAEDTRERDPGAEVADFIDFELKVPNGLPVIRLKFCPFCGKEIPRDATLRVVT